MKRVIHALFGLVAAVAVVGLARADSVAVGNEPVPRAWSDSWSNFVLKLTSSPIPANGTLTKWEVNAASPGRMALMIWSGGTGCGAPAVGVVDTAALACQARVVAMDERDVAPGLNTFTSNIAVHSGETLGLWIQQGHVYYDYFLGNYVTWCVANGCAGTAPVVGADWDLPGDGDWHWPPRDRTYSVRAYYSVAAPGIDIKPGTTRNPVNLVSEGVIPVALLGRADFDVHGINAASLRFGATGVEAGVVQHAFEDVNGDGIVDLIAHFRTQDSRLTCYSTQGVLTGGTRDGDVFTLSDVVAPVGPICR